MTEPARHPWICPTCGHFIVRPEQVNCRTCEPTVQMVPYMGADQATAIRQPH